ncbi:MAG: UDP-3-O-acyl-N-acetylglucosamine deacetylase, partial [Prochlorococcaceae cyanobacterium]
ITATPAEGFQVVGVIDFPQVAIGRQQLAISLTPERFVEEIAPARTFGFKDQVEQLREAGLIQGGALDNALVCDGDQWVNPPLRFADEPVRHKLLDLIGDLALVGLPLAQVMAFRASHNLHTQLAAALAASSAPLAAVTSRGDLPSVA